MRMSARASSARRHEAIRPPSVLASGCAPLLFPVVPMDLKVFHRTKAPLRPRLMSPLTKWQDTATEGSDTKGSQDVPQDKDTARLAVLVPAGKDVV